MNHALLKLLLSLLAAAACLPSQARAADLPQGLLPLSAFPRERIVVETRSARRHVFEAWRTDTFATRAQGLMFVEELRPDQAMIFLYEPPERVAMWMKNTLIPLDMLFVDARGCVVKVHEQARPHSLDSIESGVPVVLVVEIKGGEARTRGIGKGDRVIRPDADWPRNPGSCGY
ncbi:MAG: DUF192 domain-containing protein [Steroidobacteraceae bacterium]